MKNDLKSSAIERVEELSKTFESIKQDVIKYQNFKSSLETKIIDFCEIYEIDNAKLKGVSIETVSIPSKIPLKDLLDVFPNTDIKFIVENIVAEIEIDLVETEENLRFSGNLQEPIIKGIMKQLNKLSNKTVKKVVIKWNING